MEHPDEEELRRFASGTATREQSRQIVAHLLSGCVSCSTTISLCVRPQVALHNLYGKLFARLEKRLTVTSTSGREVLDTEPEILLQDLEKYEPAHQQMVAVNSERFRSASLAKALLDRSYSFRYKDSVLMLRMAQLAVTVADRVDRSNGSSQEQLWDLRAGCYAQLAHAHRVSGDMSSAEEWASIAQSVLHRGTGDPLARGLVCETIGSVRGAQLRYMESIHSYSSAIEIYRHLRCDYYLGRALVGQAIVTGRSGAPQEALALLSEAIPKVADEARLTLAACHAYVRFLIADGRIEEAACRWIDLRGLYTMFKEPLLQLRATWLEGLLLKAQGRYAAALKLFEATRRGFRERGSGHEAALASLDIAACYSHLNRKRELRQALTDFMGLADQHTIDRQALVQLISLRHAASIRPSDHGLP